MSIEQNKAVVRRFLESGLNVDSLVDEVCSPDYVNHLVPGGREGAKQFFPMMRSAFPDLKFHTDIENQIAEGDYVAARITYHITNAGKEATGYGVCEYRLANNKIVEEWPPKDTAVLLQQVGAILPSGEGER